MCTQFLYTMPDCLTKTIESLRKHKLEHWDRNRETNRAWLSLNMMTEANAGYRIFHYGDKKNREVDFVRLRQRLAQVRPLERGVDRRNCSVDCPRRRRRSPEMNFEKIRFQFTHQERVARITLASPKANILDRSMIRELDSALATSICVRPTLFAQAILPA